jgi:DNA polymerase III delta subunit
VIVFVHGPDATLARDLARAAAVEADPSGENTSWLDGKEVTHQQVIGAIGTVSFFGGGRVVVVSDFLAKSGGEGERAAKANANIATLAASVPDGSTLVLLEPSLSSPPAALKAAVPSLRVLSGAPPRGPKLLEWIAKAAQDADSRIDRQVAQALADALFPGTWQSEPRNPRYDRPPDLGYLRTTIETLALAAYPDPITAQDVAALVSREPDQRIFKFLDAMLAGDLAAATREMESLERGGEEPGMVLAQALGQVELVTAVAAAGNRDTNTVAKELGGVTPGRVSALAGAGRRESQRRTSAAMIATEVDRNLKTGKIRKPEEAIATLITALSAANAG